MAKTKPLKNRAKFQESAVSRKAIATKAARKEYREGTSRVKHNDGVYFSRWLMDMGNGSSLVHVPYPKPHTVFVDKNDVPEYMRHVTPRELTMEQYEKYEESIADYDEPFYIDSDHKMIYIEEKYI